MYKNSSQHERTITNCITVCNHMEISHVMLCDVFFFHYLIAVKWRAKTIRKKYIREKKQIPVGELKSKLNLLTLVEIPYWVLTRGKKNYKMLYLNQEREKNFNACNRW